MSKAFRNFTLVHEEAKSICKKTCKYLSCQIMTGHCPVFTEVLFKTIILRMEPNYELLGVPVIKLLDGRYKVFRLDDRNLLLSKLVQKQERTRMVKGKKGKIEEKKIGGYEGYNRMGYHPDLESVMSSIVNDFIATEIGEEEDLVELSTFKKNIIKIKKTLVEEIKSLGVSEVKLAKEDADDDEE